MSDSCETCSHYKEDDYLDKHCEFGVWGEMFGWCSHHEKKGTESERSEEA